MHFTHNKYDSLQLSILEHRRATDGHADAGLNYSNRVIVALGRRAIKYRLRHVYQLKCSLLRRTMLISRAQNDFQFQVSTQGPTLTVGY